MGFMEDRNSPETVQRPVLFSASDMHLTIPELRQQYPTAGRHKTARRLERIVETADGPIDGTGRCAAERIVGRNSTARSRKCLADALKA